MSVMVLLVGKTREQVEQLEKDGRGGWDVDQVGVAVKKSARGVNVVS